jgi:hypothetical protein
MTGGRSTARQTDVPATHRLNRARFWRTGSPAMPWLMPYGNYDPVNSHAPGRHLIADCSSLILRSSSGWIAGFPVARAHPMRPSPKTKEHVLLAGYDQCRGNRMSVNRLPPVGRIRAVHLPQGGPRVPKSLTIEYSDRSSASKWYQLEVPFVDAMHLLTLLQGAKDDVGYKEPVEVPAPEKD